MNEDALNGWLSFAAIGFIVCLIGWISTSNSLSIANKTIEQGKDAMQSIVDDANVKYNSLLDDASQATDGMVSNFTSVCDELWSNSSVQNDCYDNAQNSFDATSYNNNPIDIDNYNDFQYQPSSSGD